MIYTFGQLKEAVRHAIGGVPDAGASRVSEGQIVNMAIAHLYNAHQWNWRRKFTLLNIAANVNVITLPADFADIIIVAPNNLPGATVRRVNEAEFVALAAKTWDGLSLGYMIHSTTQSTPTSEPTFSLGIAPASPNPIAPALSLWYMRSIPSFAATGTADDAKIPDVPQKVHHVLVALCRAYAVSVEDQQESPEWQLAKQALQEAIAADIKAEGTFDGAPVGPGGQYTFGQLKGIAANVLGEEVNRHSLDRIVNEAVLLVETAYPWQWRQQIASYTIPDAGPLYSPPIGLSNLIGITAPDGRPVTIVAPETLMQIELGSLSTGGVYYAALVADARANSRSSASEKVRFYPRAVGTVFTFHANKQIAMLVNEADTVEIPLAFSLLLVRAVRAVADEAKMNPSGKPTVLYKEMLEKLIGYEREARVAVIPLRSQIPSRRSGLVQNDGLRVVYP